MTPSDVAEHVAPGRILVADDQPDVVTALSLLLRSAGFETDPATSVQGVRERLGAREYDLLLMDLNYARDTTSGREGLDLLAEIHRRDRLLPIIVMTGWGSIDTAVEAMRLGARTFVTKPWDNARLAETIRREVDHGATERREHAHASRELEHSRLIQRSLLPSSLPAVTGFEMAALWEPASDFGGDCYDARQLSDARIVISIGDVVGKGLPAALLMSNLQAFVRAFADTDPTPRSVVANVNRSLCLNGGHGRFVTFFYAVIDPALRTMKFSNAGHHPPILVRADGSIERLSTGGVILGVFDDTPFDQGEVGLQPGDRLVLFTDGITEAMKADGVEFGEERVVETVLQHRRGRPASIAKDVLDRARDFAGGTLTDDATLMCVAVDGSQ